jgi:hypothetical protein
MAVLHQQSTRARLWLVFRCRQPQDCQALQGACTSPGTYCVRWSLSCRTQVVLGNKSIAYTCVAGAASAAAM